MRRTQRPGLALAHERRARTPLHALYNVVHSPTQEPGDRDLPGANASPRFNHAQHVTEVDG